MDVSSASVLVRTRNFDILCFHDRRWPCKVVAILTMAGLVECVLDTLRATGGRRLCRAIKMDVTRAFGNSRSAWRMVGPTFLRLTLDADVPRVRGPSDYCCACTLFMSE